MIKPRLAAGRLLLLLDGVDEVALGDTTEKNQNGNQPSPRETLLSGITAPADQWIEAGNRILLTSRPYSLATDQVSALARVGLPEAQLDTLPEPLQELLATRWFHALPKFTAEASQTTKEMLEAVRGLSGDVSSLTANPLLLTALCIIYGEGKKLPQDLHELYDRIVRTTLVSRYGRETHQIDRVRGRLAAVAFGMHSGKSIGVERDSPARDIHIDELDTILSKYIDNNPETESGRDTEIICREDLLGKSGLIESRADSRAAFSHWSFQEFLAAERLMLENRESEQQLAQAFCDWSQKEGWRPTLGFLFGRRIGQLGTQ